MQTMKEGIESASCITNKKETMTGNTNK